MHALFYAMANLFLFAHCFCYWQLWCFFFFGRYAQLIRLAGLIVFSYYVLRLIFCLSHLRLVLYD